ncbi:MAG: orotidine-5'-phosphate decarboxylase [Desulfobacteraceae bacterium]
MKSGKDYIVFPLDFPSFGQAEKYVKLLSDRVGMFKIGLELFIREGPEVIRKTRQLSSAGIFLDLKLHDISATVQRAVRSAAELEADLLTVHCASSIRMLEAAVGAGGDKTGILGVTLLTDNDAQTVRESGFSDAYWADPAALVMKRAEMACQAGCAGVVCSGNEVQAVKHRFGADFMAVTPGIRPAGGIGGEDDQKRVCTPGRAVTLGADLIVVGRPIRDAPDPEEAAKEIAAGIDAVIL